MGDLDFNEIQIWIRERGKGFVIRKGWVTSIMLYVTLGWKS